MNLNLTNKLKGSRQANNLLAYTMQTKKYPFYLMAQLIQAKLLSHEKSIISTDELYADMQYVCDMLVGWNEEQFKPANEADLIADALLNDADNDDL